MEIILLIAVLTVVIVTAIVQYLLRPKSENEFQKLQFSVIQTGIDRLEKQLRDDFRLSREEFANVAKANRDELSQNQKEFIADQKASFEKLEISHRQLSEKIIEKLERLGATNLDKMAEAISSSRSEYKLMREDTEKQFQSFQTAFDKNVLSSNELLKIKFDQLEYKQVEMITNVEAKLNLIKTTVEEKLEKTLSERLGQSFDTVGKQLIEVQKGLGEMQILAQDVGGLKKVLSNVKMRGGIGEVQLGMLLEQVLSPDQYQANVKTKVGSEAIVEFAIKLPGRSVDNKPTWLPIDAKFPKDVYDTLLEAYDKGDLALIDSAQRALDATIKKMAKDISEKYLDPPNTTDFGILFLPFEGIFAEVVRKTALLEDLQRNYKIMVTGPTTLGAILNSLQMGFKTLAIEKRSSEVWQVLGAVKKEFENFSGLMKKAQSNIQTGLNQLDDVMGVRTRAIEKRLRGVESLSADDSKLLVDPVLPPEASSDAD